MRILLVEDDQWIAKTLETVLSNHHYVVDVATDGQMGWELVQSCDYDLIMLDVVLPKMDGIQLCQQLRSHNYQTPVLLLTAQGSSSDRVMGLDAGADDYVVKPFDLSELLARIRVLLRRKNLTLLSVLEHGKLRLDSSTCEVTYCDRTLHLTPKEFRLLELFLRNKHRVLSRSAILDRLWSFEEVPNEDTVTAHVKGLRQKLKVAGVPTDFIETIYGLGYRLKQSVSDSPLSPSLPQTGASSIQQQAKAVLAQMWEKLKEHNSDRLAILERAAIAMRENALDTQLQYRAKVAAHKLAGTLGTFGFIEGSHLALEIEQLLDDESAFDQNEAHHFGELIVALRRELKQPSSLQVSHSAPELAVCILYVVDDDVELAQQVAIEAASQDLHLELALSLSEAREKLHRSRFNAIILDLQTADAIAGSLTFLAELTNLTPLLPVLLFTAHDSLSDRVKVARFGAHAFLQKPLLPSQAIEAVNRVLQQVRATEAKVMVVDDDPQVLAVMRSLLEPWGLKLTTLDEPRHFWTILEEFAPDLLVLDVEMPHFNGIELCQVVRNAPRWSGLPVLFLTVHTDASTVHQVFSAGADDIVSKPIVGPELVTRVLNRLERVQLLRNTNDTNSELTTPCFEITAPGAEVAAQRVRGDEI
jgi:DNA-binding response OmpR family regulator